MDLLKVKEMNNIGIGNGFNLYLETEKKIASFLKTFEEDHMTWLEEVLLEARKTFSRRSLTLLPKTPSNAKRNRRIRPNSDDTEESSTDSPPAKKRVHRKSLDSEAETSQDNASKRPTRSTRASTRRPTQEKCKRTTRGKQPKTVSIMENNKESFSDNKESISAIAANLPEKDNRVKKLIDHHEKIISESSDEDFHSPKRLRKYMKNELDTVPEAKPQSIKEQIIEPVEQKCVSEKSDEESIPCKKSCSSSEESDVFKESVQMPLSDHESIAATTSNDEDHALESEDAPKIDEPSQNECEERSSAAESKLSSSSDELSGKEIINETKEEVSMEEDSLNEGANALAQTSFNNVRMSISMSKSKKRSSLSKRRLSRDSRQSLRTSKRLSILAKNAKMESCDEEETDGRRQTRSSVSNRRLSSGSSTKKSVRRSLNASKRLSVSLQKSMLESCQDSQSSDASHSEDAVKLVKIPVEVADGKNTSGESNENSEDFTSANEATPELKKKSTRTKQVEPIANVDEADQPTSNEEVDTSDEGKPSIDSEKESPKKTTRTRTKLRRNKKKCLQNEGTAEEEEKKMSEPIERKKSGIKNKRASQFDDDVNKKVKKLRLSHDEKDETSDGNVVASQSNISEQFDDSLEPSSSEEVKPQSVPKRKSRRRTQDSDSDERVTVAVTKNRSPEQEAQEEMQHAAVSSEDSCDEEVTDKTPSPKCPAEKVIRPQPQSFLHRKKEEGMLPTNSSGIITSFIKRNTPKKKTTKERQEEIKAQIREKQKKEEEIRKKLQQERKNKLEEQRRKREDRARKAAEARERRILQQNEKRIKLEEFYEHKQALTEKQKEEKKREEMQKKKLMTKKRVEAEERRRVEEQHRKQKLKQQEEEEKRYKEMMTRKKEFEEQERLQKQEEWRLQQEQRKADQEKQRLEEAKRRVELEIENEREQQRIKEKKEKERREIERVRIQEAELREREKKAREEAEQQRIIEAERLRREQDRIKERENLKQMMMKEKQQMEEMPKPKLPLTTNTAALNTTVTKEPDMKSPQSYDITPQRIHKPSTEENYCIDDINSDDSTDDEEHPRKKIPSWAQGASLRAHLIHQIRFPVDLDKIFGAIEPPDLTLVFQKKRARYLKRTSSAVWNSPIFNKY
ncbi:uncharacterized protein [Antedon mediterranea]|uniref:uncharacterized protein n=1 Tax=Antedon mediterranea TaxID=105859 RepID=UPI003AF8B443